MNIYLKIILGFILLLCIYWLYKRYNKYNKYNENKEIKQLKTLIESIKNHITITLYNMNKFIDVSLNNKKILLKYAQKYKHEDIIKLLS